MDGKDGPGASVIVVTTVEFAEICGNQTRLVVVTVKDVWRTGRAFKEIQRRALKEDPTIRLVGVVLAGGRIHVDTIPIEEAIVTDQNHFDGGIRHDGAMDVVGNRFDPNCNAAVSGRGT